MPAEPYRDPTQHLRDELRRAWLRVEYQIRLGWTREQVAPAGGEQVTPTDMGRLFAAARGDVGGDDAGAQTVLEQWLALHREVEARVAASVEAGVRSPMTELWLAGSPAQR